MILKLTNNGQSVYGTREDGATVSYSIEAEEYKQWLSEGNTPEPEFTEAEIVQQVKDKAIQEAYAYLASTAWYIERLNDPSSGKAVPQEVLDGRANARLVINELEG